MFGLSSASKIREQKTLLHIYIYNIHMMLHHTCGLKIVANKRTILSKPSPSRKKHSPSPFGMASCPCET